MSSVDEGYITIEANEVERVTIDQDLQKKPVPCPFQIQCWRTIRAPIARKGFIGEDGKRHKVYMPYICTFSEEGELEKCSHFHRFKSEENVGAPRKFLSVILI